MDNKINIFDIKKSNKKQLVFAGCGGMYNYSLGVASVIQKNCNLDSDVVISGSSAGCFPAMLTALDMDIDDMFETWNVPFLNEVNTFSMGSFFHWNNTVRKHTLPKFSDNAYKSVNGRLYCSMTSFPDLKNHIISDWKSNQDLLDGIMASSFVPLFDNGKLTSDFRNKKFIDGSVSNSEPLPLGEHIPSFIVKRDMWRQTNMIWLWCWSDEDWARKLYRWGKEDASDNLEEIKTILNPSKTLELY